MHRLIASLLIVAWATAATAQVTPSPTFGSVNVTGASAYKIGGSTVLNIINGGSSLAMGVSAGAALPAGDTESTLGGFRSGWKLSGTTTETTAYGWSSCASMTTGTFNTCIGTGALWNETGNGNVEVGGDAARDTVGMTFSAGLGFRANQSGASLGSSASGFKALQGNSATVLIGGSATNGDTISLLFQSATAGFADTTIGPINITTAETTAQMATAICDAITSNGFLGSGGCNIGDFNTSLVVLNFPGTHTTGWTVTITPTVTGSATETVTVGNGFTGQFNFAGGYEALEFQLAGVASKNIGIGAQTGVNCVTCTDENLQGYQAGFNLTTGVSNILHGNSSGYSMTTAAHNLCLGDVSCYSITTGANNIVILAGASTTSNNDKLSTGASRNILIGYQLAAPNVTASNQLLIGGVISGNTSDSATPGVCAVGVVCMLGRIAAANLNTTGDQAITILPLSSSSGGFVKGATRYVVTGTTLTNCSGATTSSVGGIYTATSKGGTQLVANSQAWSGCTSTAGALQTATLAAAASANVLTLTSLQFSLTTPNGSAETGDLMVWGYLLP